MSADSAPTQPTLVVDIPRPPNSWILFRCAMLDEFKKQRELDSLTQQEKSARISQMWKNADTEVKDAWHQRAKREKEEHAIKYPGYKYNPRRPGEKKKSVPKKRGRVAKPKQTRTTTAEPTVAFAFPLPLAGSSILNQVTLTQFPVPLEPQVSAGGDEWTSGPAYWQPSFTGVGQDIDYTRITEGNVIFHFEESMVRDVSAWARDHFELPFVAQEDAREYLQPGSSMDIDDCNLFETLGQDNCLVEAIEDPSLQISQANAPAIDTSYVPGTGYDYYYSIIDEVFAPVDNLHDLPFPPELDALQKERNSIMEKFMTGF